MIDTSKLTLIKEIRTTPEQVVETKDGITKVTGFGKVVLHDGKKVIKEMDNAPGNVTMTKHQVIAGTSEKCRAEISKLKLTALKE
jgi:hypothetical protein